MLESEKKVFFAQKAKAPTIIHMGGKKVILANFPIDKQEEIKKRLAEKDPVLKNALETTTFGIKIDGKEIGADNIHEFEIKPSEVKAVIETKPILSETKKYTSAELKKLNKAQQTKMLKDYGITKIPKLEINRINKILELQG